MSKMHSRSARPRDGRAIEASAPSVAAVPPSLPGGVIRRLRLERLVDSGTCRRLTTLVADAGFGKSTLLAAWSAGRDVAWHTVSPADRDPAALAAAIVRSVSLRVPAVGGATGALLEIGRGPQAATDETGRAEALAGVVCAALEDALTNDLVLVLDDLETLDRGDAGAALVAAMCRQAPGRLHVVLSSRVEPPFVLERLRLQGQVLGLGGNDLAFTARETARLISAILGEPSGAIAERLHAATGGWPAGIRLAVEALARVEPDARPSVLHQSLRAGDPIVESLVEQVLAREPPVVRRLVGTMAMFDRFTVGMCEAVGILGASETLAALSRRGLFAQPVGAGDWYMIHPIVRPYALRRLAPTGSYGGQAVHRAVAWALANGADRDALSIAVGHHQNALVRRILETRGQALLAAGQIDAVIDAAARLRPASRTPVIVRLEGEARQVHGDWDGALALFSGLRAQGAPLDAGLAWRMGLIHHLRGELDEALKVYGQGARDAGSLRDRALLAAWTAAALWLRGDVAGVRAHADEALAMATEADDDGALAVTHTVLAMVAALDGDRRANDVHYLKALDHASAARDVLTLIRIRANRGSRFIEEGAYGAAIEEVDEAIRLGEVTGFAVFHALALSNRGEALFRLGRLEEARSDLEQSRAIYQRLESRMVAYPMRHLGDVRRERGDRAMARAHYEEAIAVSEPAGDLQALVPAMAGLALVLAEEDPNRAAGLASRAVALGPTLGRVGALLALGRIRTLRQEHAQAAEAVGEAAALARLRRDRAGLAEALELEAALAGDRGVARSRLLEALALWNDLGAVLAVARVEAAIAASAGSRRVGRARRTAAAGAPGATARKPEAASPSTGTDEPGAPPPLEIRTLGGFEVRRRGELVQLATWGSRRARDLVKILVSRRGRRVPREQLMEILWPEADPVRAARRLSVMISTARAVLDPDRGHWGPGAISADRQAVWLSLPTSAVDVEGFLVSAGRALADGTADPAARRSALAAAAEVYRGDFLEDDPYVDWAVPLREEARGLYLQLEHALAHVADTAGDPEAAALHLRRVLERDPFDEAAHLTLVEVLAGSRRAGDARRAYRAYVSRMEELGVEAAPFPQAGRPFVQARSWPRRDDLNSV